MINQQKIYRVFQLIALLRQRPPKTIRFLAGLLESTDRTVYRYFNLLRALGFDLQADERGRYFITASADGLEERFTSAESELLRTLVLSAAARNKLRDSILKKLSIQSDQVLHTDHLVNARLSTLVQSLSHAIRDGRQVVLGRYHSAHSGAISDRLVEPIRFTDQYRSIAAFEVASARNKLYNLERITTVEVLPTPMAHRDLHSHEPTDVFGFTAQSGEPFQVQLLLGLRAYVLLREEYPLIQGFLHQEGRSRWRLDAAVNDARPVVRFILGHLDDVEVLGSASFIGHLRNESEKWLRKLSGAGAD